MNYEYISYQAAYQKTLDHITPLSPVQISVNNSVGYVVAETIHAQVNAPSVHTSLKDGYAVLSSDIEHVSNQNPVRLKIIGSISAGQKEPSPLNPGDAFRILTGAKIPEGADTVVAEEFVSEEDGFIIIKLPTPKGKNILDCGYDIQEGEKLLRKGDFLTPARVGLLVSGGRASLQVYQKPSVAIIATGDEVLLPGEPLSEGKLYASNLITLHSWCRKFGFNTKLHVVDDKREDIKECIKRSVRDQDIIITSGGAWSGDKDLMAKVLNDLGWNKIFHRVRLGPGKAAGFGLLSDKPVFILPGGPPSNLVAFLQLALPGLFRLCGRNVCRLPEIPVVIEETVNGQSLWTDAIFGNLDQKNGETVFLPDPKKSSRLKSMANAQALLLIPEGVTQILAGERLNVQVLNQEVF